MIEILRTGSHMCVVDIGREGYQSMGVPVSGAMDMISLARANSLLGNKMTAAVLELYLSGHQLQFQCDTYIALTGATAKITMTDRQIYNDEVIKVRKGDILSIGATSIGCRIYLAVAHGIKTESLLGSRSPLSGYTKKHYKKGDKLHIKPTELSVKNFASSKALSINKTKKVECTIGPEWGKLSKQQQQATLSNIYLINHQSDRMGYRLEGSSLDIEAFQIFSSAVMTGTVQLLPSGLPIILMRDCQTTGGYPRILQVTSTDINQLAQRKPNDEVQFVLTEGLRY